MATDGGEIYPCSQTIRVRKGRRTAHAWEITSAFWSLLYRSDVFVSMVWGPHIASAMREGGPWPPWQPGNVAASVGNTAELRGCRTGGHRPSVTAFSADGTCHNGGKNIFNICRCGWRQTNTAARCLSRVVSVNVILGYRLSTVAR